MGSDDKTGDSDLQVIIDNINRIMTKKGMLQKELAEKAGLKNVSTILSGERTPRWGTLKAIATALGLQSVIELCSTRSGGEVLDGSDLLPGGLLDLIAHDKSVTGDEIEWLVKTRANGGELQKEDYARLLHAYRVKREYESKK